MRLDNYNLARCTKCNRLMEKKEGQTLCSRCLTEAQTISTTETTQTQLSDTSKLKLAPAQQKLETKKTSDKTTTSEIEANSSKSNLCARCKEHPKLPNRNLCLSCITELYKSLQNATEELSDIKQHNPYEDIVVLQKTLSSVRKLEPFRRIRVEGLTWVKRPK